MNLKIIKTIRTNNFKDNDIIKKITNMWSETSSLLKNSDKVIYGLYYDYQSNYKGDYSLSIAIEENGKESSIEITDTSKYEIFKVDTEDENGILNAWNEIWDLEEKGLLERAYTYDYEKYYPNGQIDIHIAIK